MVAIVLGEVQMVETDITAVILQDRTDVDIAERSRRRAWCNGCCKARSYYSAEFILYEISYLPAVLLELFVVFYCPERLSRFDRCLDGFGIGSIDNLNL